MKKNIVAIIMLMMCFVSLAYADAPIEIWSKSRTSGYADFDSAMKDKGWSTVDGFKVEGLCAIAYNAAVGQKMIAETLPPQLHCNAFMKRNGVGSNLVSEDKFRDYRWYLPDMQYVVSVNQPAKITAQAESKPVENTVQPNKAKAPDQQVAELKQQVATIAQRPNNDKKTLTALKEAQQGIDSLTSLVNKLEKRGLTEDMSVAINKMITTQVQDVSSNLVDINSRLDAVEARSVSNETRSKNNEDRLARVEKAQADSAQASKPYGYDFVKTVLGEDIVANYLANPTLIQGGSVLIFVLSLFLVYANRIEKIRKLAEASNKKASDAVETANGADAKAFAAQKLATEAVKQVSKVAAQVAGMMEYSFDQELVKREALEESIPNIGDSFPLLLDSADGDDITLEIMRSKANEITIKGALRQQGGKTPLSCGLDSAVVKINRAIRDGRIEKPANLKIAV